MIDIGAAAGAISGLFRRGRVCSARDWVIQGRRAFPFDGKKEGICFYENKIVSVYPAKWRSRGEDDEIEHMDANDSGSVFAAAFASFYVAMVPPARGVANSSPMVLGPEIPMAPINVAVWLKLHDEAALDAAIQQMYNKSSANYHHWLTFAQYKAQFAPTAQDAATARDF